ncbi:MAG: HlyD family efflux transporter periplasmic adaptor subunit, partial [Planctomycetales bacterium]|nr:HlyD family efflux transporter periplasmic adaptor subunit [Planctomycetales bacterium]
VAELGELCAGALQRAAALDGPLTRRLVGRAQRSAGTRRFAVPRWLLIVAAVGAAAAALAFIQTDFEAAAPATLLQKERREVFAAASGRVSDVRVAHAQRVEAGEVLAVIDDPQLQLQWEQVTGELETVSRRIDALSVARTERGVREDQDPDAMPPGAEQQQLVERRASLRRQRELLARRREELTLRSPVAGIVLTRDVESLLASRPVQRGQTLLTIADPSGGWELVAELEQQDIGRLVAAQTELGPQRPVRFRLAGDVDQVRDGAVEQIDAVAPLDVADLAEPPAPVRVHIAVDDDALDDDPRPGMRAEVRIDCGRRSVGYVWFHDLAAAAYRWWSF